MSCQQRAFGCQSPEQLQPIRTSGIILPAKRQPRPRLSRTGAAYCLLMPNLSATVIGLRDPRCFDWPPFNFLSTLASASSEESSTSNLSHILRHIYLRNCSIRVKGHVVQAYYSAHRAYLNSRTACDRSTVIHLISFSILITFVPCSFC